MIIYSYFHKTVYKMVAPRPASAAVSGSRKITDAQNEYNIYSSTNEREYGMKMRASSGGIRRGVGPKPPQGTLIRVGNNNQSDEWSRSGITHQKMKNEPALKSADIQKLTHALITKRRTLPSACGLQSQIVFDEVPSTGPDRWASTSSLMQTSISPLDMKDVKAGEWLWPTKRVPGNGSLANNHPTDAFGTSAKFEVTESETKAAFKHRPATRQEPGFWSHLVREKCHVADTKEPNGIKAAIGGARSTPWKREHMRTTDPVEHQVLQDQDHYGTMYSSMIGRKKGDTLSTQLKRSMRNNPKVGNIISSRGTLRDKLQALSGNKRANHFTAGYARSISNVLGQGDNETTLNVTSSSSSSFIRKLTRNLNQTISETHASFSAPRTSDPETEFSHLYKNPPFCRDGVHPTTTNLEV